MKIEKRQYKTYLFEELSEEAQEKAIENHYDINVNYEWWDNYIYEEIANNYGLKIRMLEINFSLDRENYCSFETFDHSYKGNYEKGIILEDYKKFCKMAGVKMTKAVKEDAENIYIDHKHYAGGMIHNYITGDYNISQEEYDKMQECLDAFLEEVLSQLKKDYNYFTSREAIEETIKDNEMTFLEDGRGFNL